MTQTKNLGVDQAQFGLGKLLNWYVRLVRGQKNSVAYLYSNETLPKTLHHL